MRVIYFIIFVFICGCSSFEVIHTKGKLNEEDRNIQKTFEKFNAIEKNKTIIIFTSWFKNDTIKVMNDDNLIFNEILETPPQIAFSGVVVVNNEQNVNIEIKNNKIFRKSLKNRDLRKYKFIYISEINKKNVEFIIEYTNKLKTFR